MAQGLSTYSLFKGMMHDDGDVHMLTQDEVEAVQRVLLAMMDDIDSLCREEGLHYVISGGCALGAVRHGGFLPWDDDIDICMPRQDCDRLRQLLMDRYGEKYYVQEIRSCNGYDLSFMKVRRNGTVFREPLDPEPDRAGVFIDIFSIEDISDNSLFRAVHHILADGLQFVCSCIRIRRKKQILMRLAGDSEAAKRTIKIKAAIGLPFSIIPFHRWLLWTDKALRMYHNNHSKYVSIPAGVGHFKGETYPRDWIFPEKRVDFAGRQYYVMNQIEKYLEHMFGEDYMTPPPPDQRGRHAVIAIDLGETARSTDTSSIGGDGSDA